MFRANLLREAPRVDRGALADELRTRIRGEVRFDGGARALYATDASNYRQPPIGVVFPRDANDVVETVATCRRVNAPVLSRGCGTSLAGQCCNNAVIMDMSRYMNNILEIDPENQTARVQPGVILDNLRHAAEQFHLTFAPDPSTHSHNTMGGMIGNNSCGVHSVMAGRTSDNIKDMEILTYDGLRMRVGETGEEELARIVDGGGRRGEIYASLKRLRDRYGDQIRARYPKIPRRVSGFNLDDLLPENGFNVARALVGSEGTCVTILEATVNLVPSPPARTLLVLGYADVYAAGDHVGEIMALGPVGLEGVDDRLIEDMKAIHLHPSYQNLLPAGKGFLLVEFGGTSREEASKRAKHAMQALKKTPNPPSMKLYTDRREETMVWEIRESGLAATGHVPGKRDTWPGWEDAAVPPDRLGDYLRDFRALLQKYHFECDLYGHFGQGCVHTRIDFDLRSDAGVETYRRFVEEAAELVVRYGGSFSGEHGDGQARAELLPKLYGEELVGAFYEFKSIWDPQWKMNPGKVVDAYRMDENLRLGAEYRPARVKTHFRFPDDHGNFTEATLRCVGVGKCRRESGGTMCPSFVVTREEKNTTRGRARLLFEMLKGDVISGGWRDEAVRDALHLCLACKGCKSDCPVHVDMATYKAEFLSHYYEKHRRPRQAYVLGLVDVWSRWAARTPRVVNFLTQTPVFRDIAKESLGLAHERQIPAFARRTFKQWFSQRGQRNPGNPPVILWADTFNNHFSPETARAAVEVLEAAGFQVQVQQQDLCCGRPLFEFGMLDRAKKYLRAVMDALHGPINDGVPVVVLEPSCCAVFRDELYNLFPGDEMANRLGKQTLLLSEFLVQKAPDYDPPKLPYRAIVHGHCHHKAVMKMHAEEEVLARLGLNYEVLDSGCCGMVGSFGFEKDKYEVSVAAGERVLLPTVRDASEDTLIIADGYSCREQIAQTTTRRAVHLADVLHMALKRRH